MAVLPIAGRRLGILLFAASLLLLLIPFGAFFEAVYRTWVSDTEFAYGILIPPTVGFLIYRRAADLRKIPHDPWEPALAIVAAGCVFQVLASLSGTLLFSGLSIAIILIGISGYLWARKFMLTVAPPLLFLTLMVPLPSYLIGMAGWKLQLQASSISARLLEALGVPVYQEGVLLRFPHYSLEVKEACSGLRSIFALLTLAVIIGIFGEKKWGPRLLLVVMTPLIALAANTVRIVCTGLLTVRFGELALGEFVHTSLGIGIFLGTVLSLLGLQKILKWLTRTYA